MVAFDLVDVIEEVLGMAAPSVDMHKVELTYQIQPEIPALLQGVHILLSSSLIFETCEIEIAVNVKKERESLAEVLLQLLSNAVAYTRQGEIKISVGIAPPLVRTLIQFVFIRC